jgi:DNA-binding response OmpR family regulator
MEKVLIQDSDTSILDILKLALEMENFHVHTVMNDDNNFLGLIEKFRPHVVMLDYKLNGEAAKRICAEIKAKYPHLPVIASSCNHNIHNEYSKSGFDGYIEKPFDLDLLYRILRAHIPKGTDCSY